MILKFISMDWKYHATSETDFFWNAWFGFHVSAKSGIPTAAVLYIAKTISPANILKFLMIKMNCAQSILSYSKIMMIETIFLLDP